MFSYSRKSKATQHLQFCPILQPFRTKMNKKTTFFHLFLFHSEVNLLTLYRKIGINIGNNPCSTMLLDINAYRIDQVKGVVLLKYGIPLLCPSVKKTHG